MIIIDNGLAILGTTRIKEKTIPILFETSVLFLVDSVYFQVRRAMSDAVYGTLEHSRQLKFW